MSEEKPAVTCSAHLDVPAVALCFGCGKALCDTCRSVGDDGLARCAACVAESHGPVADATQAPSKRPESAGITVSLSPLPLAWERDDGASAMRALWSTFIELCFNPMGAMTRLPQARGDLVAPLLLSVLCGIVGHVATVAQAFAFSDLDVRLRDELLPQLQHLNLPPAAVGLLALPMLPLGLTVRLFAVAIAGHVLLGLIGVRRRSFETTFRVYAYASAVALLSVLPGLGPFLSMGLVVLLTMQGLRISHGATPGQAAVGALPYLALLMLSL